MSKIKAFVIDGFQREIFETELEVKEGSSYDDLKKWAAPMSGIICVGSTEVVDGMDNTMYVDDEGLLHGETRGFVWLGQRPQGMLIGRGVIEGSDDEGASTDSNMTLEEVKQKVIFRTFTQEQIDEHLNKGFQITTF